MPLNVNKLRINADDSLKNTIVNKTGIDDSKCIPDTINRIIDEAGSGEGAEYTGGTGISVDNSSHTITNTLPGISYNGKDGINVSGSDISAKIDDTTIKLNSQGQMTAVNEGKIYNSGDGINVDNTNNKISAKIDGTTIKINEEGKMYAEGGSEGKIYEGGPGIEVDNQNDKINAKVDGVTVGVNSDNQLQAEKYEINITSKSGGEGKTYTGGNGIEVDNANDTISAKINDATMEFVDGKLSAKAGEGKTYTGDKGVEVDNTKNEIRAKTDGKTIGINSGGQLTCTPPDGGTGIKVTSSGQKPVINANVDDSTIKINDQNQLYAVGGGSSGVSSITSRYGLTQNTSATGAVTIEGQQATSSAMGMVKVQSGNGLKYSGGLLSMDASSYGNLGACGVFNNTSGLQMSNGLMQLKKASSSELGGVMVDGNGLDLYNGVLRNKGVTSFNGSTGAVSGITSVTGSGTGISVSTSNHAVTIKNTGVASFSSTSMFSKTISCTTAKGSVYIGWNTDVSYHSNAWDVFSIYVYGSQDYGCSVYSIDNGSDLHYAAAMSSNHGAAPACVGWGIKFSTNANTEELSLEDRYKLELQKKYINEYKNQPEEIRARRWDVYIPQKRDLYCKIGDRLQPKDLKWTVYYNSVIHTNENDTPCEKVMLEDMDITGWDFSTPGIKKITVTKGPLIPATFYIKVEE